jgi:hypothetical protein
MAQHKKLFHQAFMLGHGRSDFLRPRPKVLKVFCAAFFQKSGFLDLTLPHARFLPRL